MNKNVLIIGGLAILGVGAYLYFKIKAEPNEEDAGTSGTATTPSGTTPTGAIPSGTTAQNSEVFLPSDNDLKLVEATVLLGEIKKEKILFAGLVVLTAVSFILLVFMSLLFIQSIINN